MIAWLWLVGFIYLAWNNSWWWIAVVIVALYKGFQWWFYKSRPWRRIHYPVMRAYASAAGTESAAAQSEGREFEVKNALTILLKLVKPDWSEEDTSRFVDIEIERARSYSDEPLIKEALRRSNKKISDEELQDLMDNIKDSINDKDKSWAVRTVIAGLIENQFSEEDRGEYLKECIAGNAK